MTGWISLHRSIENHWTFKENRKFSKFEAWIDILLMVNHKDKKIVLGNELVFVKRGQKITSIRKLCERWSWSNNKVKNFLKLLEEDGMLIAKSDAKKTLLTVVNYDIYQHEDLEKRRKSDANASQVHQVSDANASQTHTNNNDNKENNENNDNKENKKTSTVYDFYQESGFGIINQYTAQDITYYLESFEKDSDEIVTAALKLALDRNKVNWGYAKAILKDWLKSNLKSISEVRAYEQQKLANFKSRSGQNNNLQSKEKTPEWLLRQKQNNQDNQKEVNINAPEFEEKKRQMEKEIMEWSEEFGRTT
ncbi:DnaD domain protein [Mammaliicoccus sciuri]|uniref:DnaD domain-containing protein n=1 Tax=Mammaliicoccus sciuri TaxID=1296 RepID=UPI00177D04EB|nr:DnaD domain protein [Mammaliicoccus sciuri]MCD8797407.1 DnaD domain protein [Mammaliicoccus sciuri]